MRMTSSCLDTFWTSLTHPLNIEIWNALGINFSLFWFLISRTNEDISHRNEEGLTYHSLNALYCNFQLTRRTCPSEHNFNNTQNNYFQLYKGYITKSEKLQRNNSNLTMFLKFTTALLLNTCVLISENFQIPTDITPEAVLPFF